MTDQPKERSRRDSVGESGARKQLYVAAAGLLVALSTAIPALVQSCAAKDTAGEAKEESAEAKKLGVNGAKLAEKAAAGAAEDYANVKAKLDPTADVAAAAATACATKAEIAELHRRIDSLPLAGRRSRRGRRVPAAVVPPEVKAPLPETPAAAAAAAPGGT